MPEKPKVYARRILSHKFSDLLFKYANGATLSSTEIDYFTHAEDLFDEFAYFSGDRGMLERIIPHATERQVRYSESLDHDARQAFLRAIAVVGGEFSDRDRLAHINAYRSTVTRIIAGEKVSLAQAEELGRFFEKYHQLIKGY
jgi:hypothetical protein